MKVDLGKVGVWSMELRFGDPTLGEEIAGEIDELGYGALWIPGGIDDAVLGDVDRLLNATKKIVIATGIINIWKQPAADVAAWWKALPADKQSRVMLGLGVSHGPIIGEAWKKPLEKTREYVAEATGAGLSPDGMCLAALGPKMLELAGKSTAGAHPYLVTPEHSAIARKIMGPGKLLAPEQGVIMEIDKVKARELGLDALTHYRMLPNYRNNWKRLGFAEDEIEEVNDRLFDGLFAWGGIDRIAERVKAHHDAGADHVCLQVIQGASGGDMNVARQAYRDLAEALL
ncbi:MAG: TIGR03620 family F420-dependent LLM class oxidoreductase [Novosphingobium sp.]|nr:TIGR03620 family F420-dependent LLM class oxidoreductase [Novosphingobium sp.]